MVQTTTSIMRSGRFAVLVGFVVAVVAVVVARAQRDRSSSSSDEGSAAATPASAPAPAAVDRTVAASTAADTVPPQRVASIRAVSGRPPSNDPGVAARPEEEAWTRIEVLVRAGEIGLARDFAEEFLRLYPYSGYCQRIETLTGVHPRPAIPGE